MAKRDASANAEDSWYEFRVWGSHGRARKRLEALASAVAEEEFDDWYLLSEDAGVNAKVRGGRLKLKRLVGERKGFQHWISERVEDPDDAPEPFDDLMEEIPLSGSDGSSRKLRKALRRLDPSLGVRPVQVHKHRRRYRIGGVRAEVTTIDVVDSATTLHTLVIEGPDLDALVDLRKSLGLRGEPNVAAHRAIVREL